MVDFNQLARETFVEHNKIRENPQCYIPLLEERLTYFKGNSMHLPGEIPIRTREGPQAVKECIEFLRKQKPVPKLTWNDDMALASKEHCSDIGPRGTSKITIF